MEQNQEQKLKFKRSIFDNVHGFISITDVEDKIISLPVFQRLRNIRQLGLLDYVFTGALHTRFNHSLGVLHIADEMVVSLQNRGYLNDDPDTRQIIRLAALLHDIGHYPLSHIIEDPINKSTKTLFKNLPSPEGHIKVFEEGSEPEPGSGEEILAKFESSSSHKCNWNLHASRNETLDFAHHERIASIVIQKSDVMDVLSDPNFHIEAKRIDDICKIIAGTYSGLEGAIIHSELDADRFDYLLRDSKQTGVSYGVFDLQQIIRNLDYYDNADATDGTSGLCVNKKGQKAVEDYLLSRYFLYSTVIFQKTSIGFHKMASSIYEGLLERKLVWSYEDIINTFDEHKINSYLNYDDSYFWNALKKVVGGDYSLPDSDDFKYSSEYLKKCSEMLLMRKPLKLVDEEQVIISKDKPYHAKIGRFHEKAVIRTLCESANISPNWFIPTKIAQDITELTPFVPLSNYDSSSKLKADSIKIKTPDNKTHFLVADDASIIKTLSGQQLNIVGIYTRDETYRDKIIRAMESYSQDV